MSEWKSLWKSECGKSAPIYRVLDVLSRTAADDSADWQFRELRIDADSQSSIISGLVAELDQTADDFDDFDSRLAAAQKSVDELEA